MRTSILVHDALEREFNIDVNDQNILLGSIRECVALIMMEHGAV